MSFKRLSIQVLVVATVIMAAIPALAQRAEKPGSLDGLIVENSVTATPDQYVPTSIQNLSKLYWALGKLDIDDPKVIDYYLMINECQMFLQYYHNDFEWNKIREATKKYIMSHLSEFPTRFEIMAPLNLGRYDAEKQVFKIADEDKIEGLRRLDFTMNYINHTACIQSGEIYEYPENLIVILSRPLVLEEIPVKPELAKLYIEDTRLDYQNLDLSNQMRSYQRRAYLRLKIHITQYKNTTRVVRGALRAVVFGRLEGYEVYADPDKMKPLYIKNIKERRFRRLRKSPEEMVKETEGKEQTPEEKQRELQNMK